jgi:hypothetical protein
MRCFLIAASFAAIVDGNHRMALLQHRLLIASGMAAFACVNRWMKTGAPRCMGNVSKGRQRSAATGLFCANLRDGVIFESWADSLDAAPSLGSWSLNTSLSLPLEKKWRLLRLRWSHA